MAELAEEEGNKGLESVSLSVGMFSSNTKA